MGVPKGDFIGFTFNGVHSSELGILRVSDGSRYDKDLLPTIRDRVVPVPGGDGSYYFGSDYTQKSFNFNIAFDSMTERQMRKLQTLFGSRKLHRLIFDELPFKYYMVKVANPPKLKYICFDEGGQRIYKGEGSLSFDAFFPFARSVHKYLDQYPAGVSRNIEQWGPASRMLSTQGTYDRPGTSIKIYNAGDIETDWFAYFALSSSGSLISRVAIGDRFLSFKTIDRKLNQADNYIRISSQRNLIEGGIVVNNDISSFRPTGSLYNKFIEAGSFFKIPVFEEDTELNFISNGARCDGLEYDYLYF